MPPVEKKRKWPCCLRSAAICLGRLAPYEDALKKIIVGHGVGDYVA
jgi:hypothetical protein